MSRQCAVCGGTGFELHEGSTGVVTSVRCACETAVRRTRLEQLARIPERYAHCTFDTGEQRGGFQVAGAEGLLEQEFLVYSVGCAWADRGSASLLMRWPACQPPASPGACER